MTEIDLDALEALANAATPGPWELTDFNEGEDPPQPLWGVVNPPYYNPLDHPDDDAAEVQVHVGSREDAEFIAAARKALPELIAEVRQLREELDTLRADEDFSNEDIARLNSEVIRAWSEVRHREAELAKLRAQRQQVLALCDKTRVGGAISCNCHGIAHGTEHDYPGCPGGRVVAWDLDPYAIQAVYGVTGSSQGEGGEPK